MTMYLKVHWESDMGLSERFRSLHCAVISGVAVAASMPISPAYAVEANAVATLIGSWGGSGRISYTDGSSESIRCTAYYTGGGNELRMAIQCKSDKNPIHIRSKLRIDGNRASGEWEERTFNASGTASGSIGSNSLSLGISGGGFTGSMAVSFSKASHSVNVSAQGVAMSRVTISFNRR
jgi:hypothetical protein